MHKVEISATVNNADGTEFHASTHRWTVDDAGLALLQSKGAALLAHAQKHDTKKGDKTARLMLTVDDGAPLIATFDKVSKDAIRAQEREFFRVGNELVDLSEQQDKGKGAHGKP